MEPDAIKECACCRFASLASVISAILQAAHQSQSALLWPLRGRLTMQIKPVESRGAPKERRTGPGIHSLAAQDTLDEWRAELYEGDRQHFGAVPEAGPASQCLAEIAFPQPSWAASALKEEGPLTVYTWKDYFKHTNIKGIQSQIHFFFYQCTWEKRKKNEHYAHSGCTVSLKVASGQITEHAIIGVVHYTHSTLIMLMTRPFSHGRDAAVEVCLIAIMAISGWCLWLSLRECLNESRKK